MKIANLRHEEEKFVSRKLFYNLIFCLQNMSPTGMSPTYPHSEPSPDPLHTHQFMEARLPPRPPSSSPPLTPQSQGTPSTMMGQYIGALNVSEDLNIHVDSLPGGFDCNVEVSVCEETYCYRNFS